MILSFKKISLTALLLMKSLSQILTKSNHLLTNTLMMNTLWIEIILKQNIMNVKSQRFFMDNPFLMNIPVMVMNIIFLCFIWNLLAQFMYMMIMSLILGNDMELLKGNYICI